MSGPATVAVPTGDDAGETTRGIRWIPGAIVLYMCAVVMAGSDVLAAETAPSAPASETSAEPGTGGGSDTSVVVSQPPARTAAAPDPQDYPGRAEHTIQGAEQALRFYLAAVNHGFSAGEPAALADLAAPGCTHCADAEQLIADLDASGSNLVGGPWSYETISTTDLGEDAVRIDAAVGSSGHTYYGGLSRTVTAVPEEKIWVAASLEYGDGAWTVTAIDSLAVAE